MRRAASSRAASIDGHGRRDLVGASAGRACRSRSVIRTDPMSRECPARTRAVRRRRARARSSRRRCRRPAPARRGRRSAAGRAVVGQLRLLGAGRPPPARTPEPVARRRRAKTSALEASRAADVAQKRSGVDVVLGDERGVLVDGGEHPRRAPRRRAGRSGRRPGRAAPSGVSRTSSTLLAGRRVEVGDEQLDRVGAAVDRGDPSDAHSAVARRRRTGRPPRSRRAGPAPRRRAGSRPRPWASDWPASTCRHLTRSGMPPAETPAISGDVRRSPRARLEVALVRGAGTPRRARGREPSRSVISAISPEPSSVPISDAARGQVR